MNDMNNIVKVAVDAYHGKVEKYSVDQSMDMLHQALVEANNGSTTLNYKDIRDGKCVGLFRIVEEILDRTVEEGLTNNDFFNTLVDYRNVARGDKNEFEVKDRKLFTVSEIAHGVQGIRRQRIGGVSKTSIPTTMKAVKIYEELDRVLSGRIDFNEFIAAVSTSMNKRLLDDIYALWCGASAQDFGGSAFYPAAGSFTDDNMLNLISHVEASANGAPATIICTKKAARNLTPAVNGTDSNSDIYNMGYWGKYYGTPVMVVPQRHQFNSTNFVMDDNSLTIIAGSDKPIKVVREGDPIIIPGDPMNNGDLTHEYLYGEAYGMGIVLAGGNAGIGRYDLV